MGCSALQLRQEKKIKGLMTEFKKVTLLVDELSSASDSLIRDDRQAREIDPSADADDLVRRRYRTGLHVSTALVDGLDGRIAKLLAKALETDPNKQVYNERMHRWTRLQQHNSRSSIQRASLHL